MTATSKLEAARDLARRGFSVFPLKPNEKVPAIANWQNLATTDLKQIEQWWTAQPNANIGVLTNTLFVADIDPRNGGVETLSMLALTEEFPKSARTQTQSGGSHYIYRLPEHTIVRGGTHKLGRGIDVKSWGGYIVAPGSTIDGRPYTWANNNEIALAPQWMIDRCKAAKPKGESAGKRVVEEDDKGVELASAWLHKHAPQASEGERDDVAYKVAARFYDYGVGQQTAHELLAEWSDTRCFPPLRDDDMARIAQSAGRNRSNAVGSAHPDAPGFEAVEIEERGNKPVIEYGTGLLEQFDDAAGKALSEAGDPLIEGVLERGTFIVTFGESGGGKSFFKLDQYYAVASGREWQGRKTKQGAILYIAAEGGKGIYRRLAALKIKYATDKDVPFFVVRASLDLLRSQKDAEQVCAWATEAAARSGFKVEAIIFDTLSRILAGGDENSPTDVGMLVKRVDYIREKTGAAVDLVHHTGKDKTKGARGHSLLRAAADTEIEVNSGKVRVTKQRDMDGNVAMSFKLAVVRLGLDPNGRIVDSCTFEVTKVGSFDPIETLTTGERKNYAKIVAAAEAHDKKMAKLNKHDKFTFGKEIFDGELVSGKPLTSAAAMMRLNALRKENAICYVSENTYELASKP